MGDGEAGCGCGSPQETLPRNRLLSAAFATLRDVTNCGPTTVRVCVDADRAPSRSGSSWWPACWSWPQPRPFEAVIEDALGVLGPFADEPGQSDVQPGGMVGDRDIGQLSCHVVTQPPLGTTPWAEAQLLARRCLHNGRTPCPILAPVIFTPSSRMLQMTSATGQEEQLDSTAAPWA